MVVFQEIWDWTFVCQREYQELEEQEAEKL